MTVTMEDQESKEVKTAVLQKLNVGEGQSWGGYMGNVGNPTLDGIVKGKGNAVVEATGGKIACTFNEDNRTTFAGQGSTYGGIPDGQQSYSIFFPQVVALGTDSFRGGFQYANTTNIDTVCTHTYSNGNIKLNVALKANDSRSIFAESDLTNNKTSFNGSVLVECGQPVVGIYNLSIQGPAASGDPFATNNGVNR